MSPQTVKFCKDLLINGCSNCSLEEQISFNKIIGHGAQGTVLSCDKNYVLKTGTTYLTQEYEYMNDVNIEDKYRVVARMYPVLDDKNVDDKNVDDKCNKNQVVMDKMNILNSENLNSKLMTNDEKFKIIRGLIFATQYLNRRNKYNHNDIKPDNIGYTNEKYIKFVDMGGATKIDFKKGLSYSFNYNDNEMTNTILFSIPSVFEQIQDVYQRDMWATASTIYYIVHGSSAMISSENQANAIYVLMMLDIDGIEYMLGLSDVEPFYINDLMIKNRKIFLENLNKFSHEQIKLIRLFLIDVFVDNILRIRQPKTQSGGGNYEMHSESIQTEITQIIESVKTNTKNKIQFTKEQLKQLKELHTSIILKNKVNDEFYKLRKLMLTQKILYS